MTNFEKSEVIEILDFLVTNGDITKYEIEGSKIRINTNLKDEEDLDFLKFRIMSAVVIINPNLDDILDIEIID